MKVLFESINDLKDAVDSGKEVFWKTNNYKVIKNYKNEYMLLSKSNNCFIGMYCKNGQLNGNLNDYYIEKEP